MQHYKILKRADGSRVKIHVEVSIKWLSETPQWNYDVTSCPKGSRAYVMPAGHGLRHLTLTDRLRADREAYLTLATPEEIAEVLTELWQKLKPGICHHVLP